MLLWELEWANHNANRNYPLTSRASAVDTTGLITLPRSFLLSAYLPVNAGLDVQPDKFFLRSLLIDPSGYNLGIAYDDESDDPPLVASVNIAHNTHTENRSYTLVGSADFEDSVGHVTIGRLEEIDALPPGRYLFDAAAGELEPDCIRPLIRGISSITLVNGTDRSEKLFGDIELVAGNNMRLTPLVVDGQDPQIIISAISGEGLNEDCVCEEQELGPCIRTINGIPPLPDGNFRFVGNDCLQITPLTHGLAFADTCSKPCCGCAELDKINKQLDRFGDGLTTWQNWASRLSAEVSQMSMVVLGSRLGDTNCLEC